MNSHLRYLLLLWTSTMMLMYLSYLITFISEPTMFSVFHNDALSPSLIHTGDKNLKTYTKPSTFVKYAIKLVGAANPIANSKFVEQYGMIKQIKYFKFNLPI
jgi:hypothetical protein